MTASGIMVPKGMVVDLKDKKLGNLNGKYDVFMPTEITRLVMNEKVNLKNMDSEKFIIKKYNILELYNSEMPEEIYTIKIDNI